MKKFALSFIVIAAFLFYSLHEQGESSEIATPVTQNPIAPTTTQSATSSSSQPSGRYKDGTYTGKTTDAFYGNIQVKATISNGKISDVVFLQYPNDRHDSIIINQQAMPILKQEAITAQSSQVDIVSGATDSSRAFIESLASALSQAK